MWLNCRVTDDLLNDWEDRLVFRREPIFISPALRSLLPAQTLVLSPAEFRENQYYASLDLQDTYNLYTMDRAGLEVTFMSPAGIDLLQASARQQLMAFQLQRGRGQIYSPDWFESAGVACPTERDLVTTETGPMYALRHDTWWSWSTTVRRAWLERYIAQGRQPCLSPTVPPYVWHRWPTARLLAGTFAPTSGPNCFATVLAAVTQTPATALSLADHWLHPGPFLRGLADRGYRPASMPDHYDDIPDGAVLIWYDDTGRPQHAACCLSDGLALNKDAQSWFTPRQIIRLEDLLTEWADCGFTLGLYVKEEE